MLIYKNLKIENVNIVMNFSHCKSKQLLQGQLLLRHAMHAAPTTPVRLYHHSPYHRRPLPPPNLIVPCCCPCPGPPLWPPWALLPGFTFCYLQHQPHHTFTSIVDRPVVTIIVRSIPFL